MRKINFRAEIDEYTSRVLGVIKEKYGLKDKSAALDRFADMYGEEFVEREVQDKVVTELLEQHRQYQEGRGNFKKITLKELDELCGIE